MCLRGKPGRWFWARIDDDNDDREDAEGLLTWGISDLKGRDPLAQGVSPWPGAWQKSVLKTETLPPITIEKGRR